MGWDAIRVPTRIHQKVKQISKDTNRKMWQIVAEAIEGQLSISQMRMCDIEEKLVGSTDMVAVMWRETDRLKLTPMEIYGIYDKMSTTMADELEKIQIGRANTVFKDDVPDDVIERWRRRHDGSKITK